MPRLETPWSPHESPHFGQFERGISYGTWRPHGTGDWLLIYTLGGSGRLASPSGSLTTRTGDLILYAPGDYQDYRTDPAAGQWKLLWSHFTPLPAWAPWLRLPNDAAGLRRLHLRGEDLQKGFVAALTRALRFSRGSLPVEFAANALEEALLWARMALGDEPQRQGDPRVRRAMDYLAGKLREPFHLETVARQCGLSVSRFAHLFKETTGQTPQQFFEQQRLRQARELLGLTGLSVAEVALEVGYDDPFYFSNRFRKHTGKSPSQWRGDRAGTRHPNVVSGPKKRRPAE
jgi:AraC family transcriptional regulator of arabinose operon